MGRLPCSVAENGDMILAVNVFSAREGAAFERLDAEDVKEIGLHPFDCCRHRFGCPWTRLWRPHGALRGVGVRAGVRVWAPADDEARYLGDEAKTAETFRTLGGRRWVVPGDLASIEADGSVTFHGRGSSVINTGGERVKASDSRSRKMSYSRIGVVGLALSAIAGRLASQRLSSEF